MVRVVFLEVDGFGRGRRRVRQPLQVARSRFLIGGQLDEATAVAERIRREVQAIKITERPDGLSSSIGVATFPESTTDPTKLCSVADGAMYVSKKAGGNRVSKDEPEGVG